MHLYKLIPNKYAKFRVGKTSWFDSDFLMHSDTLFAAIVNNYVLLYGTEKLDLFIDEFLNNQIKVSSVFYTIDIFKKQAKNEVFQKSINFFPKPFIKTQPKNKTNDDENISKKKIKQLNFISEGVLKEILERYDKESNTSDVDLIIGKKFISDEFCCLPSELETDMKQNFKGIVVETKNEIDRENSMVAQTDSEQGKLFSEIDLIINQIEEKDIIIKPNMFFLSEINSDFETQFNASVRLMCDEGLGGERSFGKGSFKNIEISEFKFEANKDIFVSFSLISPSEEDIKHLNDSLISYNSILRGGWTYSYPHNRIRMISEGAVFNSKISGNIPEVQPKGFEQHKIFKYGKGIFL